MASLFRKLGSLTRSSTGNQNANAPADRATKQPPDDTEHAGGTSDLSPDSHAPVATSASVADVAQSTADSGDDGDEDLNRAGVSRSQSARLNDPASASSLLRSSVCTLNKPAGIATDSTDPSATAAAPSDAPVATSSSSSASSRDSHTHTTTSTSTSTDTGTGVSRPAADPLATDGSEQSRSVEPSPLSASPVAATLRRLSDSTVSSDPYAPPSTSSSLLSTHPMAMYSHVSSAGSSDIESAMRQPEESSSVIERQQALIEKQAREIEELRAAVKQQQQQPRDIVITNTTGTAANNTSMPNATLLSAGAPLNLDSLKRSSPPTSTPSSAKSSGSSSESSSVSSTPQLSRRPPLRRQPSDLWAGTRVRSSSRDQIGNGTVGALSLAVLSAGGSLSANASPQRGHHQLPQRVTIDGVPIMSATNSARSEETNEVAALRSQVRLLQNLLAVQQEKLQQQQQQHSANASSPHRVDPGGGKFAQSRSGNSSPARVRRPSDSGPRPPQFNAVVSKDPVGAQKPSPAAAAAAATSTSTATAATSASASSGGGLDWIQALSVVSTAPRNASPSTSPAVRSRTTSRDANDGMAISSLLSSTNNSASAAEKESGSGSGSTTPRSRKQQQLAGKSLKMKALSSGAAAATTATPNSGIGSPSANAGNSNSSSSNAGNSISVTISGAVPTLMTPSADRFAPHLPLEVLMSRAADPPRALVNITSFLQRVSRDHAAKLFASSGTSSATSMATEQQRADTLRVVLDSTPEYDLTMHETDPRCVGLVLRSFLRDLPTPLVPTDVHKAIRSVALIDVDMMRTQSFHLLLHTRMPAYARTVLLHLLRFFTHIKTHASVPTQSIANCFAPLLLGGKPRDDNVRVSGDADYHPSSKALRVLMDDFEAVRQCDQTATFTVSDDGVPLLRSCTAQRLIDTALESFYTDENLAALLLLFHPSFLPSVQLAESLVRRCAAPTTTAGNSGESTEKEDGPGSGRSSGESATLFESKSWQLRLNVQVGRLLTVWLREYPPNFNSPPPSTSSTSLFEELKRCFRRYLDTLPPSHVDVSVVSAFVNSTSAADFLAQTQRNFSNSTALFAPVPSVKLCMLDAMSLAEQMTLIDRELFGAIPLTEFFCKNLAAPATAPRFHEMVRKWNSWGHLVAGEILSYSDVGERAEAIGKIIQLSYNCRKLNNFNTAFAVFCGLQFTPITRLKHSWDKVSRKQQTHLRKLDRLFGINAGNYRLLREETRVAFQSNAPLVPYVGYYTKTVATLEEMQATLLENQHVNVEKLRQLHRLAEELLVYQRSPAYTFAPNTVLQNILWNAKPPAEEQLFERSLALEPKP